MFRQIIFAAFICISIPALAQVSQVRENVTGISRRVQYEIDITKDPRLGYVPQWKLIDAYKYKKEKLRSRRNPGSLMDTSSAAATIAGTTASSEFIWTERGPYTDGVGPSNGNTRANNGKTSGRIRAILEDADGSVWIGGIDGGLWRTASIASNPATWTPINDFFTNMAIASICQDPTNPSILYFGTGEKAINADAVRGAGIWMSTDHGFTWNIMPGSGNLWNVSKVVCDNAGNLYVACNTISNTAGLQRMIKGSGIFQDITPSGLDPRVPDIELSSTGRLHISCGYYNSATASSGYRFTDNPATVTPTTWSSPVTSFPTQYNVDLASKGDTLYALPSNSAWEVATIYKSTNGGLNWSPTGSTPSSLTNGQAWYDMCVGIDPRNANNVIVGGLNTYKSTNGGSSWTQMSNWVGTTGQYVHADQHIIVWNSNNRVLVGSDGGLFYSADGGVNYSDRNTGLRIKQFYSVAIHPTSTNYFLAGAQDNGVHQLNGPGLAASLEVTGGDGAFVHIDQNQPQYQFGSYVYSNYRRSTDGGQSWSSTTSNNNGRFINPTDYDDSTNIMYCSYTAGAFARWTNAPSSITLSSVSMPTLGTGVVSAVKVSPYTLNTVFFAGTNRSLTKAVNANGATPGFTNIIGNSMPSGNISCVELGSDENNILVTYSNYGVNSVWLTTDGGSNWTSVEGNLPDMPVRWAMFYPGDNSRAILATETGVWQTSQLNGSSTVWNPESGFPNVRVDMLQYRRGDSTLIASTHGRGLFTTKINPATSSTGLCSTLSNLAAGNVTTNSSTISWAPAADASSYDVDYKSSTASVWINAATATTSVSVALSGLTPGETYNVRARINCVAGAGDYSSINFTTLIPCGTVSGLSASSVTNSSGTISWATVSGASSYDVDYKEASTSTWLNRVTGTTALSTSLTSLVSNTLYDVRVRANCPGGTGTYSAIQFTTLASCNGTYDGASMNNNTLATAILIPFNTNVNGTISSSTDVDYYKFQISRTGTATISLSNLIANYDVFLQNGSGTTLASGTKTSNKSESFSYNFTTTGTYYLKVAGVRGANNSTSCYTLKVTTGTAATQQIAATSEVAQEEHVSVTVKAFPNPTSDKLTVYVIGDDSPRKLNLVSASGRKIYEQNLVEMFTTLNLHKLAKGVYFLQVISADGRIQYAEKVIKK